MLEGTKIFYTGDMANGEGYGHIVKAYSNQIYSEVYDIEMNDGRKFPALTAANFSKGPGQRFHIASDYDREKTRRLEAFKKKFARA